MRLPLDNTITGLLLTIIRGDDVTFALSDYLLERVDDRAEAVRALLEAGRHFSIAKMLPELLAMFSIYRCNSCELDAEEDSEGCAECKGVGWSLRVDRERVDCKLERWREVDPYRRAIIGEWDGKKHPCL